MNDAFDMPRIIPQFVELRQVGMWSDSKKIVGHTPGMEKSTTFREETGLRLKRLREHLGLRQEDLGQIIGMVATGISNIEKGIRGLDPEDALRLKRSTGVTLDWLYGGDAGSLPNNLLKPMTAKVADAVAPSRKRKTSSAR